MMSKWLHRGGQVGGHIGTMWLRIGANFLLPIKIDMIPLQQKI